MKNFYLFVCCVFMFTIDGRSVEFGQEYDNFVLGNGGLWGTVISGPAIIHNGQMVCGNIACPAAAFQCAVSRRTISSNNYIFTERNCTTLNGTLLLHKTSTTKNPQPGKIVKTYNSVNEDGRAVNCDTCTSYEEAFQLAKRIGKHMVESYYGKIQNPNRKATKHILQALNAAGMLQPNIDSSLAASVVHSVFTSLHNEGVIGSTEPPASSS